MIAVVFCIFFALFGFVAGAASTLIYFLEDEAWQVVEDPKRGQSE